MFKKRTFVVLSLLLTVVMLSGCLGIFKGEQTIDKFLAEVNSAHKSLDLNKIFDLYYFGDTPAELVESIKEELKWEFSTALEILKLTKGTFSVEIVPSKDKDAIVENKNDAVINKGTITFTVNFDPSLLANVKASDFSQAGYDWLETEWTLWGESGQTLEQYLAEQIDELREMAEDEGLPLVDSWDFDDPMYLKKVNKKWKFDAELMFDVSRPT